MLIYQGTDATFEHTLTDADNTAVTTGTLKARLARQGYSTGVVSKTATHYAGGVWRADFTQAETAALAQGVYELQWYYDDGSLQAVTGQETVTIAALIAEPA